MLRFAFAESIDVHRPATQSSWVVRRRGQQLAARWAVPRRVSSDDSPSHHTMDTSLTHGCPRTDSDPAREASPGVANATRAATAGDALAGSSAAPGPAGVDFTRLRSCPPAGSASLLHDNWPWPVVSGARNRSRHTAVPLSTARAASSVLAKTAQQPPNLGARSRAKHQSNRSTSHRWHVAN